MGISPIIKNTNKALIAIISFICTCFAFTPSIVFAAESFENTTNLNIVSLGNNTGDAVSSGKTGDPLFWLILVIGALLLITFVVLFIYNIRQQKTKSKTISSAILVIIGVLGISLLFASTNAFANENKLVNDGIEVRCNVNDGPITYGEGVNSNHQVITNTTDRSVLLTSLTIKGDNNVGHWMGVLPDSNKTVFDGTNGTVCELEEPVLISVGESVNITWDTTETSNKLLAFAGTSPACIVYSFMDAGYIVNFEANGGTPAPDKQEVLYGDLINKPTDPNIYGYDFVGWFSDKELTSEWDFDKDIITEDLTLYAKYSPKKIESTFGANGGTWKYKLGLNAETEETQVITQTFDDNYILPDQNPKKTDYDFVCYKDANNKVINENTIVSNADAHKISATWSVDQDYRDAAISDINDFVNNAKENINALTNLSDVEKKALCDEIDKIYSDATNNINDKDNTTTIEQVDKYVDDAINDILDKVKEGNKADLEKYGDKAKDIIDSTSGLTDEDKDRLKKSIDSLVSDGKFNIDDQGDIGNVKKCRETFEDAIDNTVKEGEDLGKEKIDGKAKIDDQAKKACDDIDANPNLSDDEKDKYKQEIIGKRDEVDDNIDDQTTIPDVDKAVEDGSKDLQSVIDDAKKRAEEQAAKNLEDKKTLEKANLKSEYDKYDGLINALASLDDTKKSDYCSQLKTTYENGCDAIDKETTITGVDKVYKEYIEKFLDIYKAAAKDDISAVGTDYETTIKNLITSGGCSETDGNAAITKIKELVIKYSTEVGEKTSVEDVKTVLDNAYKDIKNIYDTLVELAKAKSDADKELKDLADKACDDIDGMSGLTDEEKEKYKKEITDALAEGTKDIDDSTTKEEVEDALTKAKEDLNKTIEDTKSKAELANEKGLKNKELDTLYTEIVKQINALKTLSAEEKTKAINNLNALHNSAKENIKNATTVADVDKIYNEAVSDYINVFKDTTKLDIKAYGTATNATIDTKTFIPETDRDTAKAQINSIVDTSINQVDTKTTIADILTVIATAYNGIDNTYQHMNQPYAVWTTSEVTIKDVTLKANSLNFFYDKNKQSWEEQGCTCYEMNTGENVPAWVSATASTCTTVYFDANFKNYKPASCYSWFLMFNISSIDCDNLDTSQVTTMYAMFSNCYNLTGLSITNFDISSLTSAHQMFQNCNKLKTIYCDNDWSTSTTLTNSSNMFSGCTSLPHYNSTNPDDKTYAYPDTGATGYFTPKTPKYTLTGNKYVDHFVDESGATISEVSGSYGDKIKIKPIFVDYCEVDSIKDNTGTEYSLDENGYFEIELKFNGSVTVNGKGSLGAYSYWDSATTTLTFAYDSARADKVAAGYSTYSMNTGENTPDWNSDTRGTCTKVVFDSSFANYKPTSCFKWFYYFNNLASIENLDLLDTSECVNMERMFRQCKELTSIDVSNFNTAKVTTLSGFIAEDVKLTSIDISSFDTSNVTDMSYFCSECDALATVNMPNFNVDSLTNTLQMFRKDANLTTIYCNTDFTTRKSSITEDSGMFAESPNLPHYNESIVDITYAYPDNGVTGYFTPATPAYLLTKGDEHVTDFKDVDGNSITSITGSYDDKVKVKPVFAENYMVSEIKDNAGNTYSLDKNGYFEVELKFNGEITVTSETDEREVYACWAPSSVSNDSNSLSAKSLNFFYDENKQDWVDKGCSCYEMNTGENTPGWSTHAATCTSVVFDDSFASYKPTTCYSWFKSYESLTEINNISNLDTSECTNMSDMFHDCKALTELDVSGFDTSKVTSMYGLFWYCSSLSSSLDVSNFDTSNVTNMSHMFDNVAVSQIDVSKFNTSLVSDMSYMFVDCVNVTALDVLNFDTSNVTNMMYMFSNCAIITSLDISNFDISKVTSVERMFYNCVKLANIYCNDNWNNSRKITNSDDMFYSCGLLPHFDSSSVDITYAYPDNGSTGYFSPKSAYVVWTTSDVTVKDITIVANSLNFFYDGNKSNWEAATTCTVYNMNSGENEPQWRSIRSDCTSVYFDDSFKKYKPTSCYEWFAFFNNTSLTNIDLSNLDTSKVTNMAYMFNNCTNLTNINLSNFDTSNVKDMRLLFNHCSNLTNIDVSTFDTGNVTNMSQMFSSCSSLTDLDVTGLDTSATIDMSNMFYQCWSLTNLDVTNFNTSNVTNMNSMFCVCKKLTNIDVTNFDTSKVTNMNSMFYACTNLVEIDVNNFDIENVKNMEYMFDGCENLSNIYCDNNWSTSTKLTDSSAMFWQCAKLPHYKASAIDKTYAYPDNGSTGYFTGTGKEAYAVWTTSEVSNDNNALSANSLNFFYDTDKQNWIDKGCTAYEISTGENMPAWNSIASDCESVNIDSSFKNYKPTTCFCWFYGFNNSNLTSIDCSNLNTSKVTSMGSMFCCCSNASTINISNFDTGNVTNMLSMFDNCNSVLELDTTNFVTSKVTNMMYMFRDCNAATTINVSNFDTGNVTSMENMFYNCKNVTELNVSNFEVTKANIMGMFQNCASVTELDVSNFDTSNIITLQSVFSGCASLISLDISNWDTSNVTNMVDTFNGCKNLVDLDVSTLNTSKVTTMSGLFEHCESITEIDIDNLDITSLTDTSRMFNYCTSLEHIYSDKDWNLDQITSSDDMLSYLTNHQSYDSTSPRKDKRTAIRGYYFDPKTYAHYVSYTQETYTEVQTLTFYHDKQYRTRYATSCYVVNKNSTSNPAWQMDKTAFKVVTFDDSFKTCQIGSCYNWFSDCTNLTTVNNLTNFDTSNTTNFSKMFSGCSSLSSLDLSALDTTSATNMAYMFSDCTTLNNINVSNFITTGVTDMQYMFANCTSLTNLDVYSFNTQACTNFNNMYQNDTSLTLRLNPTIATNMYYTVPDYVTVVTT